MAQLSAFPNTNLLGISSSSNPIYVSPTTSASALTGNTVKLTVDYKSAVFFLNINQTSPSSSHLLNVYVEHSPDGGTTFDDFVSFFQVAGKAAASTNLAGWVRDVPSSSATVRTPATRTLAAGSIIQGPVGGAWRAEAVVTGASSSQPWQLNLIAQVAQ